MSLRGPVPSVPPRPRDAHKGTFGHVLCLAGSTAYPGAAILCARAALRGGAGLVTLGHPAAIRQAVHAHLVCEMATSVLDDGGGFAAGAVEEALLLAHDRTAVALGPGISRAPAAAHFARDVALLCERPLVLDADGLNAFAGRPELLRAVGGRAVLTPHPGELMRLIGCDKQDLATRRAELARQAAERSGCVVLLKGEGTIVADPAGGTWTNPTGNPGLATGGAGDVLTGVIAALLAAGLAPFQAACLGAWLHGRAADLVARRTGWAPLIATDLLEGLIEAIAAVEVRA